MGTLSFFTKLSRTKKAVAIVAILIFLYGIIGFFVAPPIGKSILISKIGEHLGRNASVKKIKINPFALSVTVQEFELSEPDGTRFIGFEEVYVNFQLSSIFRWAFTFSEIHLIAPEGQVKVLPDGSLNFSDLLAKFTQSTPTEVQSIGVPPVLIFRLQIEKGRFTFKDLSLPTPYQETFFPIQFTLNNFSTREKDDDSPHSFTATMGESAGISWEGDLSVNPVRSQGRLAINKVDMPRLWQYIQDYVNFEVTSGSVDLSGRYKLAVNGGSFDIELTEGEMQLGELILTVKGSETVILSVPSLSVSSTEASLMNKQVVVASVTSQGAKANGWLGPDGKFWHETVFALEGLQERFGKYLAKSGDAKHEPEMEAQPWIINIQQVNLENYAAHFEDRTVAPAKIIDLDSIKVDARNLSTQKDSKAEVAVGLQINQAGIAQVKGLVSINPVSADLTLKVAENPVKPMQPYVDAVAPIDLASGTVNMEGRLQFQPLDSDGPKLSYQGRIGAENIKTVDRRNSEVLYSMKSFSVKGMTLDVDPNRLSVSEVFLNQPDTKVVVSPEGEINVATIITMKDEVPKDDKSGKKVETLLDKVVDFVTVHIQGPMPINIDTIRVENGAADFSDLFVKPKVTADVKNLRATVKGLSSKPTARADVLLQGAVNKYAPVKISGQINPLTAEKYADVAISFKNFDLAAASPYSGKFAGYKIDKGKLTLNLRYKVSGNEFSGENGILVEQFTLGERVESPDATKLPVSLGVALLKDSNGNIELDVPVSGNLDDPRFDFEKVVADAIGRMITNAVKSPFAALGNLVGGGGEDLSYVEFEFGQATLEATQVAKLDKLSEALNKRPGLKLEIEGAADKKSDRMALAEAELLNQLKLAKIEELQKAGKTVPESVGDMTLSDDDVTRLITQRYTDTFGKDPKTVFLGESEAAAEKGQAIDQEMIISAAKQRLVETMPVDESQLQRLAQERAMNIQQHLVQQGKIASARLHVHGVEIIDGTDAAAIRTALSLSGA
jgi:outer membrane protein OmpA-like peptidoglycan-associated protein